MRSSRIGELFFDYPLNCSLPRLKRRQFLHEVRNFLANLAQFRLSRSAHEVVRAKLFNDVLFKLTAQDSEIWVAPNRSFSVFKPAGSDALHNEIAAHPIFLVGRYVAQGCALTIPFTVFSHLLSLENEKVSNLHGPLPQPAAAPEGYPGVSFPSDRTTMNRKAEIVVQSHAVSSLSKSLCMST